MIPRSGPPAIARLFPALAERQVRRYFVGQSISVLGTWIQNITLNLLLWDLAASPALLGLLNFLLWGPAVVVTPLAGPRTNASNARTIVAWTVAGSLAVSVSLALLHAAHWLGVPLILGFAAARGLFSGLETPARQVLLTSSIADGSRIANAVAMNTVAYNGARMIGPAIAAAIYGTLGAVAGLLASAAALAVMLAAVRSMPSFRPDAGSEAAGSARPGLRAAIAYVRADRLGSLFLPVATCLAILGSSYQTLVPVLADRVYGDASSWTGLFFAAAGGGSTAAALLLSSRFLYPASRLLQVVAPWTVVVALAGLGASRAPAIALACFAVLGFSLTFTGPGTNAKLHQNAPAALRGALAGLYALAFTGAIPVGNLLVGSVAQWLSVQGTFLAMSAVLAICLSLLFVPRWIAHGRIVLDGDRI